MHYDLYPADIQLYTISIIECYYPPSDISDVSDNPVPPTDTQSYMLYTDWLYSQLTHIVNASLCSRDLHYQYRRSFVHRIYSHSRSILFDTMCSTDFHSRLYTLNHLY